MVASGATFIALTLPARELRRAEGILYLHVQMRTRKCYVGLTVLPAVMRWARGGGYRMQRRFGAAIAKHGWEAFDSHVLAFFEDRVDAYEAEREAIKLAGGHGSELTYNSSPGGDLVAENDKPLVGINLQTQEQRTFKSGTEAARVLGLFKDGPAAVARGERVIVGDAWWFRFAADEDRMPPALWGETLRVARVRAAQARPLVAVHMETGEERCFESAGLAAATLRLHPSAITSVAKGKYASAGGWWFRYRDAKTTPPALYGAALTRSKRDRAVYALNLKTRQRRKFRNCTVADTELSLYAGAAAAVAAGDRASAGGWWFSYRPDQEAPTEYGGKIIAKLKARAVEARNLATGKVRVFPSGKEASEALGVFRSSISLVANGKIESAQGYTFRFVGHLSERAA
jgi:hypothetical protein